MADEGPILELKDVVTGEVPLESGQATALLAGGVTAFFVGLVAIDDAEENEQSDACREEVNQRLFKELFQGQGVYQIGDEYARS